MQRASRDSQPSTSAQRLGASQHNLCLLSIDGGGIRGLSALLILKEILFRIQKEQNLDQIPLACDVFDLAGGTGTGGIIVIMLFRLRMPIGDAIKAYVDLSKNVFSNENRDGSQFDASLLEDALIKIIKDALGIAEQAKELPMLDEGGPKCFVCAMSQQNLTFPILYRSWTPPAHPTYNCTVVEACRATTADLRIFSSIEIGEVWLKDTLIGGSLRCNNPVNSVWREAKSTFPDQTISCVVSIGAGIKGVLDMKRPLDTTHFNILHDIATDCEITSDDIANQLSTTPGVYFRLNVDQGLQNVGSTQCEELAAVQMHTVQYLKLHAVDQKVARLVRVLVGPSVLPPTSTLSEVEDRAFRALKDSIAVGAYYDLKEPTSSECQDGTRVQQIKTLTNWIKANEETKPLFVVLGPAGSGKSSLLRTIARICEEEKCLAASFFFSGTDPSRNATGQLMNTIAYQIAEAIPELRPYVARSVHAKPTILTRSLELQTQELLLEPLNQLRSDHPDFSLNLHPRVVVIDALDECLGLDDQLRIISALAKVLAHESFPFLCMLSSRYNLHIEQNLTFKLTPQIYGKVILGRDVSHERADVRTYLRAKIDRIRDEHAFGTRIPLGWPTESDLEPIVKKSGAQFIYASTVIKYIESPDYNPYERLQYILDISTTKFGPDLYAELDALYRALMSSLKPENLTAAIEILGIELVRSNSQFWIPSALRYYFDFKGHFCSLDADVVLAPLASVLKCHNGHIKFYHLSFAEFLLDSNRSGEYFVQPMKWQKWITSRLVPHFYNIGWIYPDEVEHLVKLGTEWHQAIDDGLALVSNHPNLLPSGGTFNIWPFVTAAFFDQLWFSIPIDKMAAVFDQREEDMLPLPILIKLAAATNLSNSFLLFEFCRTFAKLRRAGFIEFPSFPVTTSVALLSLFITYLSNYLDDQHQLHQGIFLPADYGCASLRCLWYIQSPSCNVRSYLKKRFRSLKCLVRTFGISDYLKDPSSNLTRGALDVLPILLSQAPPSVDLLTALGRPFDSEVESRTPSTSLDVMDSIRDYLMRHDPKQKQSKRTALMKRKRREDEPLVDFEVFLHRKGRKLPWWIETTGSEGKSGTEMEELLTSHIFPQNQP